MCSNYHFRLRQAVAVLCGNNMIVGGTIAIIIDYTLPGMLKSLLVMELTLNRPTWVKIDPGFRPDGCICYGL